MATTGVKLVLALLVIKVLFACLSPSDAQVTFSRDWKAGKRSGASDCQSNLRSVASLCHMLIREVRAGASCEGLALARPRGPDLTVGPDLPFGYNSEPADSR